MPRSLSCPRSLSHRLAYDARHRSLRTYPRPRSSSKRRSASSCIAGMPSPLAVQQLVEFCRPPGLASCLAAPHAHTRIKSYLIADLRTVFPGHLQVPERSPLFVLPLDPVRRVTKSSAARCAVEPSIGPVSRNHRMGLTTSGPRMRPQNAVLAAAELQLQPAPALVSIAQRDPYRCPASPNPEALGKLFSHGRRLIGSQARCPTSVQPQLDLATALRRPYVGSK